MKTRSQRGGGRERDRASVSDRHGDTATDHVHLPGDSANTMYGLVPVLEALRVGHKRLEQITIAEEARTPF